MISKMKLISLVKVRTFTKEPDIRVEINVCFYILFTDIFLSDFKKEVGSQFIAFFIYVHWLFRHFRTDSSVCFCILQCAKQSHRIFFQIYIRTLAQAGSDHRLLIKPFIIDHCCAQASPIYVYVNKIFDSHCPHLLDLGTLMGTAERKYYNFPLSP